MKRRITGFKLNLYSRRFGGALILAFLALALIGCSTPYTTLAGSAQSPDLPSSTPAPGVPNVVIVESPNPAYANAQATKEFGKSQMLDLSRRATAVSLDISQAAIAAAQSTKDFNHRLKLDLDYQSTIVSLNITQAVATQNFILKQTRIAQNATAAAQSSEATAAQAVYLMNVDQTAQAQAILDAQALQTAQAGATLTAYPLTATYSAYLINVTGTAQAQFILNARSTQTAQAIAALTAYPKTATPFAVTQAALLMQQYTREQQNFVDQVVAPLIPLLIVLDLIAFILVIVLAYRRSISISRPRGLQLAPGNVSLLPLPVIDGVISDVDPLLQPAAPAGFTPGITPVISSSLPGQNAVHVEIINAAEPPVAQWIAEVEHQMTVEEGL